MTDQAQSRCRAPLRIGEILDSSFDIFRSLIVPICILSVGAAILTTIYLGLIANKLSFDDPILHLVAIFILGIAMNVALIYVHATLVVLSDRAWQQQPIGLAAAAKTVSVWLILRIFVMGLRVALVSALYSLFLLIPGVIYFINRSLADYILIIEKFDVGQSLYQSRALMTHHPGLRWYSFGAPQMRLSGIYLVVIAVWCSASLIAFLGSQESLVVSLVSNIFSTFGTSYSTIALVGFYLDLRSRAEGTDLEHEARALLAVNG